MTRAEAWLTGVGAVLALVPAAVFGAVLWSEGDRGAAAGFVPLAVTPTILALGALALPDRRAARAALTLSAALLLLPISLLTYFLAAPALATMITATVLVWREPGNQGGLQWPMAVVIPVVSIFWLAAGAIYLGDGTRAGCGQGDISQGITVLPGVEACTDSIEILGLAAMLALLAIPALLVLYLVRTTERQLDPS